MKLDKDNLIKQRFWVVIDACLPLVLLALLLLLTSVPGGIARERKAIEEEQGKMKVGDVKTPAWVEFQKKVAEKQKSLETVVWEKSWDPQARIMTWPEPFEEMYHFRDGFFANEIKV